MRFDRVNQWLTLVANLGVVVGFFMVAFQLQQNTDALRLQADAVSSSATVAAESGFMGEDVAEAYAIAWQSPEQLSDAQMLKAGGYLITSLSSVQYTYQQYGRGLVSDDDWDAARAFAVAQLNWPFGRAHWRSNQRWLEPGFVAAIDQALAESPEGFNYMEELKANLRLELDAAKNSRGE
jgi:hypothetical protein